MKYVSEHAGCMISDGVSMIELHLYQSSIRLVYVMYPVSVVIVIVALRIYPRMQ